MASPQATVLPELRSPRQLLEAVTQAQEFVVHPPRILTADGEAFPRNKKMALRSLQNCGTNVVYWAATGPSSGVASPAAFHGVLAACTAEDDGTGGIVDLSRFVGRIAIHSVAGAHRVATFEASWGTPPA